MSIKLFVDDIRACPEGWIPARTVTDAIRKLAILEINEVSLDHDIQVRLKPQYPVLMAKEFGMQLNKVWVNEILATSPETFEAVAWYLSSVYPAASPLDPRNEISSSGEGKEGSILVRIHTANIEKGKDMAKILGIPYVCTHYPYDFRKDRDIKEGWEE